MIDKVDVLMCTMNNEDTIEATLLSLFQSDTPINRIVVVDGNSIDNTIALITDYCEVDKIPYIIIKQKSKGYGGALNEGAMSIKTKVFASIDSDTIIPVDFYKVLKPLIDIDKAILASLYNCVLGNAGLSEYYYWRSERNKMQYGLGACLINKEYMINCLPLKELISGADSALYKKAMLLGYKWILTRETYSYEWRDLSSELKHLYWWGKGAYEIGQSPIRVVASFPYSILLGVWLMRRNIRCFYAVPLRMLFYNLGYFNRELEDILDVNKW